MLDAAYGHHSPSRATVYKWFGQFRDGRKSVFDEERSGAPKKVTTEENVNTIHDIVVADRRIKLREIEEMTGISYERVHNIVHDELGMKKVAARWVPRLLSPDQKRNRAATAGSCLDLYRRNPLEFCRRFVAVDETWIYHNTRATSARGGAPKKAKTAVVSAAKKVLATVFWDAHGILLIDYADEASPMTGQYYCGVLDKFDAAVKAKRPHLEHERQILFHHVNAAAHSSLLATQKLRELRYELLPHPANSPDLAPSDFVLFPNLKKSLAGKRFTSNDEVIAETNAYFDRVDKSHFLTSCQELEKRWARCIELKGDYVEK